MKKILKKFFDYMNGRFPGQDKWLHFWGGFVIAVLWILFELWIVKRNGFASSLFLIPAFSFPFGAMCWVAVFGALKEYGDANWDWGVASRKDFRNTVYGGLVGAIGFWVIILLFKIVPSDGPLITPEREWKERMEEIHRNDPASFEDGSSALKQRSDSLLKIMFEKSKKE